MRTQIVKMRKEPELFENEEAILTNPGFYKDNLTSGWKSGYIYLTNFRLFLWQLTRIIFQISLEDITGINIEQRGFILRIKDALCLSYLRSGGEEVSRVWIIVKDIETWEKKIFERSLLQIDQEAIDRVSLELDPESQMIVTYIWQNRFATIEELATLCDAPSHMDILLKIKEVINPAAEKTIGHPLLIFEKSKIDPETGKKILFCWWLIGGQRIEARRGTLFDIFDEGKYLRIIMELFGINEKNIQLKVNEDELIIHANSLERKYQEEIPLPARVNSNGLSKEYRNGILEVRLEKFPGSYCEPVGALQEDRRPERAWQSRLEKTK
ncbi:MAG: Hsp20/alpha crystallin family protein [Candidatus Aminicenantaceae bacterium]